MELWFTNGVANRLFWLIEYVLESGLVGREGLPAPRALLGFPVLVLYVVDSIIEDAWLAER